MKITAPGVYTMDAETYHADPCVEPSLSSTGARTLASECPAAYWFERTNPTVKREFELGRAGHLMVLEPHLFGQCVRVIEADDYRTKAAKDARDEARAAGLTPLLQKEADQVRAMREVLWRDPIAKHAFEGGQPEQAIFWQDAEFGIWRRTRPDYLPPHQRYLVDYKTSTSANPKDFERAVFDYGYHQQAAWYLDGVEAVTGTKPERFAFVVQSKKAPFLVTTCWLDAEAIEWGRKMNRLAIGIFARCLRTNSWPGFTPEVGGAAKAFTVTLPHWALRDLAARDEAGLLEPPTLPPMERAA